MLETLEIHPWINFPKVNGSSTKLILGSFPPPRFTEQVRKLENMDIDFFYGSYENSFWELFFESQNKQRAKHDYTKAFIKNFLEENHWAISDIVLKTHRAKKNSASDNYLRVKEYNTSVISEIIDNNPIQVIFFTSRWVQERFEKNIEPCLKKTSFTKKTLISPSRSGFRRLDWARNEIAQIKGESNLEYRKRYYQVIMRKYANK